MLPKRLAVHNFVKKIVLKTTSTSSLESLYSSCHFCQFASNSLRDLQGPKMTDYRNSFGRKKIGTQIRLFLACLCCQKQLKVKSLIKNGIIPCSKILTQITLYLKTKLTF